VVNGRIVNFHSDKDTVVKYLFTQIHPGHTAIGITRILTDVPEDEDGKIGCKKAYNLDVTKECTGHSEYRQGSHLFLPMVPFLY
jgi:hypothetical protein